MIVKLFYDLETTGLDERIHSIHQIAGMFEVDGKIVETFNFKVAPHPKAQIDPQALSTCKVTEEQIRAYPSMQEVYKQFVGMLKKYCNRFDKTDKIWLVGFNNRKFDDIFLSAWFKQNGDEFFPAWFWPDSLDVLVLASQHLIHVRSQMPSFKLKRVAMTLQIPVDESKLHDGLYDVGLTYQIYQVLTNKLL